MLVGGAYGAVEKGCSAGVCLADVMSGSFERIRVMKKLFLMLALAVMLSFALAAPAFADLRPSVKTAYVVPKLGVWLEVKGDVNIPVKYVHLLTNPNDPIPANYDVILDVPWRGITRGLVQTVPLALKYQVSIPAAGLDMSRDEAMAYWSGAVLWDQYWSTLLNATIPAFNPSIGAQAYANHWWGAVTGAASVAMNLTSDKKLPQGSYTGLLTETVVRTITDLKLTFEGQTTPVKREPGTATYQFTFVVGPPVP
jgi:hypothetical protein